MGKQTFIQKIIEIFLAPFSKVEYYFADRWLSRHWIDQVPKKHKDGTKIYWGDFLDERLK